jgi:hypothetical protein
MPPLKLTAQQMRNRIANARAKAANKRTAVKANAKNLRYPSTMNRTYMKLKSTAKTCAPRNTAAVNYNKYANQLVRNRLTLNLPSQRNAEFKNKVSSLVKNRYQTNNPLRTIPNNSPYINRAIQKLRTELNRIRNTPRTNSSRPSSPPKPKVKITLGPKLMSGKKTAPATKKLFANLRKAAKKKK